MKKKDQQLLEEAYQRVVEDWHDREAERREGPGKLNLRGMSDVQDPAEAQWRAQKPTKTAKHISTSKAGHFGDMAVYELSPKLQETPTEWLGFTTDSSGKVTLIDPDSTMLDPIEIPHALRNVDFTKTSPESLLKKLGYYLVADKK